MISRQLPAEQQAAVQPIPAQDTEVQTYLDALEKPLASLGKEACADWRNEAAAHLESLIVANEELGSSREEAIALALQQFGNQHRVGQRVAQAIRQQRRPGLAPEFLPLVGIGFSLLAGMYTLAWLATQQSTDGGAGMSAAAVRLALAASLFVLPVANGLFWAQLRNRSSEPVWRWKCSGLIFVVHGFVLGLLYANLFEHQFGVAAVWAMPSLLGAVLYPLIATAAAMTYRRLQSGRTNGRQEAQPC